MKKINFLVAGLNMLFIALVVVQCQHSDDPNPIAVKGVERGTETLSCTPNCTPLVSNGATSDFNTSGVASGVWYFDKAHSNVTWETEYQGVGSLLTGRFNYFVLTSLTFEEQNPSKIAFEGYVRLNTVNTGEPGRDGGCLLTTYGTAAGKTTEPENIAKIVSTSVTARTEDAGYNFKADVTFHGVTKSVSGNLYYVKQTYQPGAGGGPGLTIGALMANFEILAITDFLIQSTNIDDRVNIKINALFKKKD